MKDDKKNKDRIVINGNYSTMIRKYPDFSAISLDSENHEPVCSASVKNDDSAEMKENLEKFKKAKAVVDEECDLPIDKIIESIKTIVRCSCFLQDEQDESDIERVTSEVLATVFKQLADIVTTAKERKRCPHFIVFNGECHGMDGIALSFGIKLHGRSDSPKLLNDCAGKHITEFIEPEKEKREEQ